MLGQHLGGAEGAVRQEGPLRHHPLPLAEQVGQVALVDDAGRGHVVGDDEGDLAISAAHNAAGLDQSTQTDDPTDRRILGRRLGR